MQSQIRHKRAELDFYTINCIASPLAGRSPSTQHVLGQEEELSQSSLAAKQINNTCVESQGDKSFFSPHQDVSILTQPLSAAFCLTGNPRASENSTFNTFLKVWAWSYQQSQACLLGNHQHASTIPGILLLGQGYKSSASKLGKDIWGVILLDPSILHCSCPVSKL